MKKLIIKIAVFAVPILLWFIIEGFLPSNTYTWRPWEAMLFQSVFSMGDFYHPNQEIDMKSVGDLCYQTPYALPKHERWKTDIIGYRNDTYIPDPDILIMGDSYAVGDRITQDSTITNLLKSDLQHPLKVYNITPSEFSVLDYCLNYKKINKPKLLIYIKSERFVPMSLAKYPIPYSPNASKTKLKAELKGNVYFNKLRIFLDKSSRMYSKNWLQSRLSKKKGDGIPGKQGSNMFFLNITTFADDPNLVRSPSDFELSAKRIITYQEYCDSLGIEFLYIPMPNKETVYFENVPYEKQPAYIANLDSVLKENNIKTFNVLQVYNDYKKSNTKLLYHLDDMHWNSNGVQVLSKELAKTIIADYPGLINGENPLNESGIAGTKK